MINWVIVSPVGRISGRTIAVKPVLPDVTGIGSDHRKSTKVLTNLEPGRNVDSVQGSTSAVAVHFHCT